MRKQEDIRNVSKEILADDKELILQKKFIRYKDGPIRYGICRKSFERYAADAGAVYKIGSMALVNTEIFEDYLEAFRVLKEDY